MASEICCVPGCRRLVAAAAGGRARFHCKYHVQLKARHGSHWHLTYRSAEIMPYLAAADAWLHANRRRFDVSAAVTGISYELAYAGPVLAFRNLRGRTATQRALIALARLREAGIEPDRLLIIYLALAALVEDDRGSDRSPEFLNVQAAKAVHRLASGTHRRWEMWNPIGQSVRAELHSYPRSSGIVLRRLGERIAKAAELIRAAAVPEIIEIRVSKFGPHASHRPDWKPVWARSNLTDEAAV